MIQTKLPWPTDAVIIVCATPETVIREKMESCNDGACRDCGQAICYDGYSMRRASVPHLTKGRPVEFLCLTCLPKYDMSQIEHMEDHRNKTVQ